MTRLTYLREELDTREKKENALLSSRSTADNLRRRRSLSTHAVPSTFLTVTPFRYTFEGTCLINITRPCSDNIDTNVRSLKPTRFNELFPRTSFQIREKYRYTSTRQFHFINFAEISFIKNAVTPLSLSLQAPPRDNATSSSRTNNKHHQVPLLREAVDGTCR